MSKRYVFIAFITIIALVSGGVYFRSLHPERLEQIIQIGQKTQTTGQPFVDAVTVDTHMHLINNRTTTSILRTAKQLVADMDNLNIDKAVIVVVPTYKPGMEPSGDEDAARQAVAAYPERLFQMAGGAVLGTMMQNIAPEMVTPQLQSLFRSRAEALLSDPQVLGFGEMFSMHLCLGSTHSYQAVMPNNPLFLELADIAAEQDVPIDFHMEAVPSAMPMPENLQRICDQNPEILQGTIEPFKELLAHNPDTRIVWQHVGWDNVGYLTVDLARTLLLEYDNLYMALRVEDRLNKVGSTEIMPNRIVDASGNIQPEWLALFREFPDRFMVGADDFISTSEREVGAASFDSTWAMVKQLPEDLKTAIAGENAVRVYGL